MQEAISEIDDKLNDQIGYVMRDIYEKTREIAVDLKLNLSSSLRKDFVTREEFDSELKLKANFVDIETQIEQKSDWSMRQHNFFSRYFKEYKITAFSKESARKSNDFVS